MTTNRNFQSLLNLIPGSTPATFEHSQFFNAQGSLQTRVNGIPRMGNLYQIEGIDDDERTGLLQIIIPPADAIQSVDITTNNFDAELGRAIGAVTNVVLKSGTNKFHGSAFEYIQNNAVNARSYFRTEAGPSFVQQLWRIDRRSDLQGQAVLLWRLPGKFGSRDGYRERLRFRMLGITRRMHKGLST